MENQILDAGVNSYGRRRLDAEQGTLYLARILTTRQGTYLSVESNSSLDHHRHVGSVIGKMG